MDTHIFKSLPKIELHVHLDCSISFDLACQLQPTLTLNQFRKEFIAPAKCSDLSHFLTFADRQIALLQTEQQLRLAIKDVIRQLKQDNIIYAEIRFAPFLHTRRGLSAFEVVTILTDEMAVWQDKWDITTGLILCTLRHYDELTSLKTAELADHFKNKGVCGFDIAGDEAGFGLSEHIKAFEFAEKAGLGTTAHAGEACSWESVSESLNLLHNKRIGHGVRVIESDFMMQTVAKAGIHLEICPSTNIQVDVFKTISDHPIDILLKNGVSLSVNTDTRTITDTNLTQEYTLLHQAFGWGLDEFKQCNLNAIDAAFTDITTKAALQKEILLNYS